MRRVLALVVLMTLIFCGGARAGRLVTFAALPAGSTPQGGLVVGSNGDFYGVVAFGGPTQSSAIFDLTQAGYLFPAVSVPSSVGVGAVGPLVSDAAGNLYGVTASGGVRNNGVIFEFSNGGTLTRFASFNGTNGSRPEGPLLFYSGQLYGTTSAGGSNNVGVVFRATLTGAISNLASLGQQSGSNPNAGVVPAGNGVFLGTTPLGGQGGDGTAFSVTAGKGTARALASFTAAGGGPPGPLTAVGGDSFFGVIPGQGGSGGAIFQMTSRGGERVVHTFDGSDGASPNGPLLLANDGLLYGTAQTQGAYGRGTIFSITTNGDFTLLASFDETNGALPQGGLVQGPDGNFYGVSLGTGGVGTVFQYGALAPEIVEAPTNRVFLANGRVEFAVVAAGSQPLAYQWLFNGAKLPGETNATLVLTGEETNDIGGYSVVVSNPYGSASAQANLGTPVPAISLRSVPATVATNTLTLQGTASAKLGVEAVLVGLNGATNTASTSDGFTHWTDTLTLAPGSNSITVYAVDPFNTASRVIRASVFYRVASQLTWGTSGFGRIAASVRTNPPPAVGRWATFTAVPERGNLFAGWNIVNDGVETNSLENPLRILLPTSLMLQANFGTNFFRSLTGTYAGLFFNPANVTPETAGLIRGLVVGPEGGFSGRLFLGGTNGVFREAFSGLGQATVTMPQPGAAGQQLTLQLTLTNGASEISGTVSSASPPWQADFTAQRASATKGVARYTLLVPPDPGDLAAPPGYGFALISARNGSATFSGRLADGSVFSEAAPISGQGLFPLYASLYGGSGLLLGSLDFSSGSPQGTVFWIKEASAVQKIYRLGFTNMVSVLGSIWTKPPAGTALPENLTISGDGLAESLSYAVTINYGERLAASSGPTNFISPFVYPSTGLARITFGNGRERSTTTGYGAVLQSSNFVGGYFLGATNAGAITWQ